MPTGSIEGSNGLCHRLRRFCPVASWHTTATMPQQGSFWPSRWLVRQRRPRVHGPRRGAHRVDVCKMSLADNAQRFLGSRVGWLLYCTATINTLSCSCETLLRPRPVVSSRDRERQTHVSTAHSPDPRRGPPPDAGPRRSRAPWGAYPGLGAHRCRLGHPGCWSARRTRRRRDVLGRVLCVTQQQPAPSRSEGTV